MLNPLRRLTIAARSIMGLLLLLLLAALPALTRENNAPDSSLTRLMSGNERFVTGKVQAKNYAQERQELVKGQQPYAIILACADSRVPPEIIFDESLGKLFIVRVAGNVIDPVVLGSMEYAVEHLHSNLLVVLGHESCGAVKTTITGGALPPNIEALAQRIAPAVKKVRAQKLEEAALLPAAIKENVRYQMQMAVFESDILKEFVGHKKLKIAGGVYSLQTGRVELISSAVLVEQASQQAPAPAPAAEPARSTKEKEPAPQPAARKPAQPKEAEAAPAPKVPEPAPATPAEVKEPQAAIKKLAQSFDSLVREAYEKKQKVLLKKSMTLRDSHERCLEDCQNIPAGEVVKLATPVVLTGLSRPLIKVQYKKQVGYLPADENDFEFLSN